MKKHMLIEGTLVLILVMLLAGCQAAVEPAAIQLPTATPEVQPSATDLPPTEAATAEATALTDSGEAGDPNDPGNWDLSGQVNMVDEGGGLVRYTLAEAQYQPAMDRLIEFFNQHAGSLERLMSEEEAAGYIDTTSSAWLGDDPQLIGFDERANYGFKWDLENNRGKNAYPRLTFLMTPENTAYYLEWKVWGMDLVSADGLDGIYGFVERFTIGISFVAEEQPLSFYDSDSGALLNRNPFYGPVKWTFFFQYLDGEWKVVEYYYRNLDAN